MKEYFNKRNLTIAAYALGVILFSILFFTFCSNFLWVVNAIKFLLSQTRGVLYGILFTLLLYPFEKTSERLYRRIFCRKKQRDGLVRAVSIVTVYLLFFLVIAIVFTMIIPPMLTTITELRASIITSINSTRDWIESIVEDSSILLNIYNNVTTYIYEELLSVDASSIASRIQALSGQIISQISGIVLGLIISVYFIASRKYIGVICAKALSSVCSPAWEIRITTFIKRLYTDFTEYLSTRILCSLYISSITFFVCRIVGIPFYPLIFLILLVFEMIPVFGTVIGALLTLTLVFITHRQYALILLITILATQIFESLVIEPAMLKKRLRPQLGTVVVVTLVSYAIFGIFGAIVAIPLFCTVSVEIKAFCENQLRRKKLPVELRDFDSFSPIEQSDPQSKKKDKSEKKKERQEKRTQKRNAKKSASSADSTAQAEEDGDTQDASEVNEG